MADLRMFRLGADGWVLALRGPIDGQAVGAAVHRLAAVGRGTLIVDMMNAQVVDLDALDTLVEAAGVSATFVAERPALDALQLIGVRRYVRIEPTLAAALA